MADGYHGYSTQIPRTGSANALSGGHGKADAGACPEDVLGGAVERRGRSARVCRRFVSRGQRPAAGDRWAHREAYAALADGPDGDGGPECAARSGGGVPGVSGYAAGGGD